MPCSAPVPARTAPPGVQGREPTTGPRPCSGAGSTSPSYWLVTRGVPFPSFYLRFLCLFKPTKHLTLWALNNCWLINYGEEIDMPNTLFLSRGVPGDQVGSPREPTRTPLPETVNENDHCCFPTRRICVFWEAEPQPPSDPWRPLAPGPSRRTSRAFTRPQAGSRSPASDPGAGRRRCSRGSHHAGRSGARPPPRVRRSHISRSFSVSPHRFSQEFLLAGGRGHRPSHLPLDFVRHSGARSPALPSSGAVRGRCWDGRGEVTLYHEKMSWSGFQELTSPQRQEGSRKAPSRSCRGPPGLTR